MFVAVPVVGAAGAAGAYLYSKVYGETEAQGGLEPSDLPSTPTNAKDETEFDTVPEVTPKGDRAAQAANAAEDSQAPQCSQPLESDELEVSEMKAAYPATETHRTLTESARTEHGRRTWKESSGRSHGGDGYVFGDVTRGVFGSFYSSGKERAAAEEEGDARFSQAQLLVRDAIEIYRRRGYTGNISFSHTVGYFTESASVRVDGSQKLLRSNASSSSHSLLLADHSKAGRSFATLISRLERRARNWQEISGMEGVDPVLSANANIGFKVPLISIGWGISISLSVTHSSLLRWAQIQAGEIPEIPQIDCTPALPAIGASPARPAISCSEGARAAAEAETEAAIEEAAHAFHSL